MLKAIQQGTPPVFLVISVFCFLQAHNILEWLTCMNFSKALSNGSGLFEKMFPSNAFSCWQYSARTRSRISEIQVNIYRPQTKLAKVMFLHVSVCSRGGGRAWRGLGMHGRGRAWRGQACVVGGGVRDTVNERAVRILLECILVFFSFILAL